MKKLFLFTLILAVAGLAAYSQNPTPTPAVQPFLMEIEDVFYIAGQGRVATGKVERGTVKTGDAVEIVGLKPTKTTTVTVTAFRKMLAEAKAGDNVGLLLKGVEKGDVTRGQVIAKPGSIKPFSKFKATIELFESQNRGRSTPISTGYRPQLFFRYYGFSGTVTLLGGKASAAPGEKNINVDVVLTETAPITEGTKFEIRDSGRTVGTGIVTAVTDK